MLITKQTSRLFLWVTVLWLALPPSGLLGQGMPRAIVRGQVVDDSTGAVIPLANVFVVSSKIGTSFR
ncbi:MAG: hypothetical protein NTZ35_09160 [Ignavibacteriales bacterium]|nr:hypothetical protein [Ignavibacteriales bacterium]